MLSGAPEDVHVKTQGSDGLEVFWAPPAPELQHGLPPHIILHYRSTLHQGTFLGTTLATSKRPLTHPTSMRQ